MQHLPSIAPSGFVCMGRFLVVLQPALPPLAASPNQAVERMAAARFRFLSLGCSYVLSAVVSVLSAAIAHLVVHTLFLPFARRTKQGFAQVFGGGENETHILVAVQVAT